MSTAKSKNVSLAVPAVEWDWLRVGLIVLCIAGMLVAGYMSWAELTGNETVCSDSGKMDCAAVQQSAYASTMGMPLAVLGFLGYAAIMGVVILEDQIELLATYGRTLVVGMALFGVILQTYLTWIEAARLDAWCQWCITSYVIIGACLGIGAYRLYKFLLPLQR
ncbi:MAG: vitamin K epoxide reductase family protein [Anaerolineae bacterium]|nr:vitamin K epoxide reductase family protein [Anaerolineae bacterium]